MPWVRRRLVFRLNRTAGLFIADDLIELQASAGHALTKLVTRQTDANSCRVFCDSLWLAFVLSSRFLGISMSTSSSGINRDEESKLAS
jgi:hypothetical protein